MTRDVADALAEAGRRIDEPHERDVDAHDPGRAEPLHGARDHQRRKLGASAQASDASVKSASPGQYTRR